MSTIGHLSINDGEELIKDFEILEKKNVGGSKVGTQNMKSPQGTKLNIDAKKGKSTHGLDKGKSKNNLEA